MYGLPKVHKDGVPLRPILAAYSTPSYKLAKFLIQLIQHLTTNQYTLGNSFEFKEQLDNMTFHNEVYLVSFDIVSLFTNVPVQETINITIDSLYQNQELVHGMKRNQFKKLLEVCVNDNHFIFKNQHYVQHEGFAMGSPLSAPMANIFLCFHENNWLTHCPDAFRPILYKRYVDDTFLIFETQEQIDGFFNYINSQHPNIRFTRENESNNKISFLDLNVKKVRRENRFAFNLEVFRKMTFTGLGLNYHSYTFFNFKLNNIKTLIFRAYRLCSSWQDFHKEIDFLLKYFKANGYPDGIVLNTINRFLTSTFKDKANVATAEKLIMYIKFPFLNNSCCEFMKREIGYLLKQKFPHIDFRFLFVNNTTFQGLLSHKEQLPDGLSSGLVYSYECGACGATYIGQTKKALQTRAAEHLGISARTGSLLARAPQSAIRDHIEICGSGRSLDSFKKVRSFNNTILMKIYESIEIHFKKPILNQDSSSHPLVLI